MYSTSVVSNNTADFYKTTDLINTNQTDLINTEQTDLINTEQTDLINTEQTDLTNTEQTDLDNTDHDQNSHMNLSKTKNNNQPILKILNKSFNIPADALDYFYDRKYFN